MTAKLTQLADNLWFVQGANMGKYPFANSMLIKDQVNCIIDLGLGAGITSELARDVKISKVVFSHCHEDHTAGSSLLPYAKFYAHSLDVDAIESVDKLNERYLAKGTELEKAFNEFFLETLKLKACHIDEQITDGYVLNLGRIELKVIHTPGHSAGHCCFQDRSSGILFSSDIDLSSFGPWYGARDSDINEFVSSIGRLMAIKTETLVSSHKGIIQGDIKSKLELFLGKIFERERRILELLEHRKTIDEIVNKALIYGKFGEPRAMYVLMETVMVKKHLEKLAREGSITCEDGKYEAT